jgi:mevalonate kinase
MASKSYKASAPGSLVLCGEHAVLHGSLAIACAVDKYITVTLIPRTDQIITIDSKLGKYKSEIADFNIERPFQFVLTAVSFYLKQLINGFNIIIESDFTDKIGLGSSAAVTVATISVLEQWLNKKQPQPLQLFKLAKRVILKVQGIGSGADVAASVYRGAVAYKIQPLVIEKLKYQPPLIAVYSGSKTPTVTVIKKVSALQEQYPKVFRNIFAAINNCTVAAVSAINTKNWPKLGELMNIHQGLQEAMGTSNKILSELIMKLRQHPKIYGAKISGAGLGDCVIGLGEVAKARSTKENLLPNSSKNLVICSIEACSISRSCAASCSSKQSKL